MTRLSIEELSRIFKDGYGCGVGYTKNAYGWGDGDGNGDGDSNGYGEGIGLHTGVLYTSWKIGEYEDGSGDGCEYDSRHGCGRGVAYLKPNSWYTVGGFPIKTLNSVLMGNLCYEFVGVFVLHYSFRVEEITEAEYVMLKIGGI